MMFEPTIDEQMIGELMIQETNDPGPDQHRPPAPARSLTLSFAAPKNPPATGCALSLFFCSLFPVFTHPPNCLYPTPYPFADPPHAVL
jgi:hypothetical protein